MSTATWMHGDIREVLPTLPDQSVDLITCSPPFWRQRAYLPAGHPDKDREIGQEPSPAEFLDVLLELTAQWRRILAPHGSIAIELGDTMSGSGGAGGDYQTGGFRDGQPKWDGSAHKIQRVHDPAKGPPIPSRRELVPFTGGKSRQDGAHRQPRRDLGVLAKSHCMIPEAYRFALVYGISPFTGEPSPAGQWIVRNVVDWCRRNPTPGDDGDKFRRATSDIVVATLSPTRWWDGEAVREPASRPDDRPTYSKKQHAGTSGMGPYEATGTRPLYDWWDLASDPYPGAHYAVWPPEVARRLIVAMCPFKVCTTCGEPQRRIMSDAEYVPSATYGGGSMLKDSERLADGVNQWVGPDGGRASVVAHRETLGWTDCGHNTWRNGLVLDPFAGSGTTGSVATGNARDAILVDLDERNLDLAYDRIGGLFLNVSEPEAGSRPET